jgi:hypothetical protein
MNRIARVTGAAAVWCAALGIGCLACVSGDPGVVYVDRAAAASADGLHEIESWQFENAFVRPGAALGGYRDVLIDAAEIEYAFEPRPLAPPSYILQYGGAEIPPRVLETLQRVYREALEAEFGKSETLSLVEQPGPGALRIAGRFADLVIRIPPYEDQRPTEFYDTRRLGEMTLVYEVHDALTDAPIARFSRHEYINMGTLYRLYQSNPGTNSAAMRRVFERTGRSLRVSLEQLQTLSRIPPRTASSS